MCSQGNIKSEYFASMPGVRQGENVSPLLFSMYINDLEEYLLANGNNFIDFKDEMCYSYVKLLVLLYADDTIVYPIQLRVCKRHWKIYITIVQSGSCKSTAVKLKLLYSVKESQDPSSI